MAKQQSHFDKVTGSSEYERQSWRDNFNGGRAAGDWSGGVNARLDSERDRYQGATEGGSSSQPSGLQLAQMIGAGVAYINSSGVAYYTGSGPGNAAVSTGTGGVGTGPGAAAVTVGDQPKATAAQPGAAAIKRGGSLTLPKTTGIMVGGNWLNLDKFTSDGGDGEDRWGDLGGSIYGLGVMAMDGWSIASKWTGEQTAKGKEAMAKKGRFENQYDGNRPIDMLGNLWNAADGAAADWVNGQRAGQIGGSF